MKRYTPWLIIMMLAVASPVMHAQEDDSIAVPAEDMDPEADTLAAQPADQVEDDYYQEYDPEKPRGTRASGTDKSDNTGVFYTLSYGAAASWLIRTINQSNEGDLTFRDFFPGLYLNTEVYNINVLKSLSLDITPVIRLAAYYPLNYYVDTSTVNRIPQKSENPWHFGIDLLAGVKLELLDFDYIRVNLSPALHLLFLGSDRWNYFNIGAALIAGIEAPLSERWTFLINGGISLDYGNLGDNRETEPFDVTHQYQVDIGFRYSTKRHNSSSLFGQKKQKKDTTAEYDEYY